MTLLDSFRRSWPWWLAGGFLVGYELLGVLFGWPLLSHMVWADSEGYPPVPWIVTGVFVVLAINFWIDRGRWVLPVGLGLIALGVAVYETGSTGLAYAALGVALVGGLVWRRSVEMNLKREPVMLAGLATAVAAVAGAYGLDLTAEQIGGFIAVVSVIVNLIARSRVTPTAPQ